MILMEKGKKPQKVKKTGCVSKKKTELYTRDRQQVRVGQTLYWWEKWSDTVLQFTVGAWHDGKSSDLYFAEPWMNANLPAWVNMQGRGGAGVYPKDEDNVYAFFLVRETWADLDLLLESRLQWYTRLIKKTPAPVKTEVRYL